MNRYPRLQLLPPSYGLAFLAGVFGAIIMSVLMGTGVWLELAPFSLETVLGTFFADRATLETWFIGFSWHLINGGLFAVAYEAIFRMTNRSGVAAGAAIGVAHWVIAGIALNWLLQRHPALSMVYAPTPIAWMAFGAVTGYASLLIHVVYGAVVGAICQPHATEMPQAAPKPTEEDERRDERAAA